LNTTVRAVFRPEAELRLFLRMRTKEIVKTLRKCIPTEELFLATGNWGRRSERRGQIFDLKLVIIRFCACAVNKGQKLAYCVVISSKF